MSDASPPPSRAAGSVGHRPSAPASSSSSRPRKRIISVPASMSVIPSTPSPPASTSSRTSSGTHQDAASPNSRRNSEGRASAGAAETATASSRRASSQTVEADVAALTPALPGPMDTTTTSAGRRTATQTEKQPRATASDAGLDTGVDDQISHQQQQQQHSRNSSIATVPHDVRARHIVANTSRGGHDEQVARRPTRTPVWGTILAWLQRILLSAAAAVLYLLTFGRAGDLPWLRHHRRRAQGDRHAHRSRGSRDARERRSLLHDGVNTARRIADKVFLRIESELEPESESETTTPLLGVEQVYRKRIVGNARIRNLLSGVPASALQRPFKVHACTWNVDQRPPPSSQNMEFLKWLVGAQAVAKIERYRELCAMYNRSTTAGDVVAEDSQGNVPSSPLAQTQRTMSIEASLQDAVQAFPDLLLVSLQEVDMGGVALVKESTTSSAAWADAIIEATLVASERKVQYKKVKLVQLVGLVLLVLVQAKHTVYIAHVRLSLTRTGPMNVLGNKGSVGMRATIYGKRFLFVSAHFVAHKYNEQKRNNNYHQAIRDLRFELPPGADDEIDVLTTFENAHFHTFFAKDSFVSGRSTWDRVLRAARFGSQRVPVGVESRLLDRHDYVFFLGDLNSRLQGLPSADIRRAVPVGELDYLLSHDELRQGMVVGDVFDGFEEPTILFPPTYKFDRESDMYDTSRKHRDPAWCDRVLFRTLTLDVPQRDEEDALGSSSKQASSGAEHAHETHTPLTADAPEDSELPLVGVSVLSSFAPTRTTSTTDALFGSCKSLQPDQLHLSPSSSAGVDVTSSPLALEETQHSGRGSGSSAGAAAGPVSEPSTRGGQRNTTSFDSTDTSGLRRDEAAATAAALAAGEEQGWVPLESLVKAAQAKAEQKQLAGTANSTDSAEAAAGDVASTTVTPSRRSSRATPASNADADDEAGTPTAKQAQEQQQDGTSQPTLVQCDTTVLGEDVIIRLLQDEAIAESAGYHRHHRHHRRKQQQASGANVDAVEDRNDEDDGENDDADSLDSSSSGSVFTSSSTSPSSSSIPASPQTSAPGMALPTLVDNASASAKPTREASALSTSSSIAAADSLAHTQRDVDGARASPASSSLSEVPLGVTFRAARFETDWSCIQRRFPTLPNTVSVLDYESVPALRMSDHRPVSAQFVVQVLSMTPESVSELLQQAEKASATA